MIRSRAVARAPLHQPIASTHQVCAGRSVRGDLPDGCSRLGGALHRDVERSVAGESADEAHCVGECLDRHRRVPLVREGEEYAVEAGGSAQSRFARPPAAAPECPCQRRIDAGYR